jgi:hypothetical protein
MRRNSPDEPLQRVAIFFDRRFRRARSATSFLVVQSRGENHRGLRSAQGSKRLFVDAWSRAGDVQDNDHVPANAIVSPHVTQ